MTSTMITIQTSILCGFAISVIYILYIFITFFLKPNNFDQFTLMIEDIDMTSQLNFIQKFENVPKNHDIIIIIQTVGGPLIYIEAICNCILNYKGKDKIKCYIPYYTCSGGLMIALCCDKIIIGKNAVISPCDGQIDIDGMFCSYSTIIEAVEYKKRIGQSIREEWLVADLEAKKCIDRHIKFINRLCRAKFYNNNIKNKLFIEFFSGKYSHDHIFTAQDFVELNVVNSNIVDKFPQMIHNYLGL